MSASAVGFPSKLRIKKAGEFDYVFEKPCRSKSRCFTVLARPNAQEFARVGLVISKRCARSAVKRNRLKRLIRESFRFDQEALSGLDIVVIGKSAAVEKENQELISILKRHWKELERCKGS